MRCFAFDHTLRTCLAAAAFLFAPVLVSTSTRAQTYPARPVVMVVPFSAGGTVDPSARLLADALSKLLGQAFVVEDRPGASGNIAYGDIARAPKDGYRALISYSATTACSPELFADLSWDPRRDFTPVAMYAVSPLMISVTPSLPVNTLAELISYLKQHPGEVAFGSSGVGSIAHIDTERFLMATGTKMVHVPYKGSGALTPDLLSGRIQFSLMGTPGVKQLARTGKLKALAVASLSRDPVMPEVPTATEAGVPGFVSEGWMGVFVPSGTPAQVVATLSDAIRRVTATPDFQQRAETVGVDVAWLGPQETAARVEKDIEECSATIKAVGIKPQ